MVGFSYNQAELPMDENYINFQMLVRLRKKSLAILVGVGAVPVMYMVYFILTAEGEFLSFLCLPS